ncbi:MAG: hypothetical protein WAL13_14840 [Trebonia sp.]
MMLSGRPATAVCTITVFGPAGVSAAPSHTTSGTGTPAWRARARNHASWSRPLLSWASPRITSLAPEAVTTS